MFFFEIKTIQKLNELNSDLYRLYNGILYFFSNDLVTSKDRLIII